ncbi:MAG: hypothetical protein M3545_03550 [Acidobacteriota bacterium]|nr:hypothetical protein [Acidobacteriota bacterium]
MRRAADALWLEAPPPGPRGRLTRIGPARYALDGDAWGVTVHMDCTGERCTALRLHIAGMEWPGERIVP